MRLAIVLALLAATSCAPRLPSADVLVPSGAEAAAVASAGSTEVEALRPDPADRWTIASLAARSWGSGAPPAAVRELGLLSGHPARVVSYPSDGATLFALVHEPKGSPPERGWPVVVVAHGYVPPSEWKTGSNYVSVTSRYASGGFLVLKPDYRGHGESGGEAPGPYRAAAYAVDTLNLVADALLLPGVDRERVFIYGHSMGGSVALVALEVSSYFKAGSVWAGVTRPFPEDTLHYLRRRDPAAADALLSELRESPGEARFASLSAFDNLARVRAPLVVRHGTADDSVPFSWSVEFRAALDAAGVRYEFFEYPGHDHNLSASFSRALADDLAFFRRVAP